LSGGERRRYAPIDRFEEAKPKPKMLAQGTCTFAEGRGRDIVLKLKKITGGGRRPVIEAVAKGLAKDSRFAVHDAQARDSESEESEGDERH